MSFKGERFLIEAIEQCNLHKILLYVNHGHNIYIKNNLGQNLLIHLLKQQNYQDPLFEKKRLRIFQFLITRCKLDIHIVDYYGKNLFNWTTNLNYTQEALYLLDSYPGDINILERDHLGLCSLHYAIEHGNELLVRAIVDYLLHYRLRFDTKDNHKNTPEELARKLGYDIISDYLSKTSRLTVFLSREISFSQLRPVVHGTKTATRKSSTRILSSFISTASSLSSIVVDLSEFYHVIELKIEQAKNSNNWKTVAALRKFASNPNDKTINSLCKFRNRIFVVINTQIFSHT